MDKINQEKKMMAAWEYSSKFLNTQLNSQQNKSSLIYVSNT